MNFGFKTSAMEVGYIGVTFTCVGKGVRKLTHSVRVALSNYKRL